MAPLSTHDHIHTTKLMCAQLLKHTAKVRPTDKAKLQPNNQPLSTPEVPEEEHAWMNEQHCGIQEVSTRRETTMIVNQVTDEDACSCLDRVRAVWNKKKKMGVDVCVCVTKQGTKHKKRPNLTVSLPCQHFHPFSPSYSPPQACLILSLLRFGLFYSLPSRPLRICLADCPNSWCTQAKCIHTRTHTYYT